MNTQQDDLAASGAREGAPLIDFAQDVVQDYHPERDTTHVERSQGVQESTTSVRESLLQNELGRETPSQWIYNSAFPPARSIRELVECLGSPVYSNTSDSPRNTLINPRASRPSTTPPSPSLFTDPASFGEQEPTDLNVISRGSTYSGSLSSSCERDSNRNSVSAASINHVTLPPPFEHIPTLEQSLERDHIDWSMGPISPPSQLSTAPLQPSFALNRPTVPTWLDSPAPPSPTLSPTLSIPPVFSPTRSDFPYARRTPSCPIRSQPLTRPLPRAPESIYDHDPIPPPAHPWNTRTTVDPISRPDRFSRTTAHTAISDILFNFDLDPATATDLIDDACQTARQVGVSTYDLLSRSVFLGTSDLGITPLCLEASRVDVDSGLELVLWLIENTRPGEVCAEVKRGCLMRRNGMGEQVVWNVLRSFVPSVDGEQAVAYDVEVEGLAVVPGGHIPSVAATSTRPVESETTLVDDDDDEGSLYDDVSIIDAESGFLDQADIETLKSSSDESDKGKEKAQESEPEPVPSRVHRARIVMPEFKESLMGPSWSYTHLVPSNRFGLASSGPLTNKVLTAEWMFEGRLWALSIGEETIILTLRQTSTFVSPDPIQVKAIVRILPPDIQWTGVEEIDHIGSDRLLPTQTPNDVLLPSPLYECEFEEKQLVPGPVGVGMNSSVWRTEIRVSMFSLLELVEPHNGIKIEVVVRVTDRERDMNVASTSGCTRDDAGVADGASIADDASDWQLVDD